jgi:hypothetical protein
MTTSIVVNGAVIAAGSRARHCAGQHAGHRRPQPLTPDGLGG